MKEQRESDLRMNLKELSRQQLVDTCVDMQRIIDGHVHEKQAFKDSLEGLKRQNQALQQRNEVLEAEAEGAGIDPTELEELNAKMERLQARNDKLQERNDRLQDLNEKYQGKLLALEEDDGADADED